MQNQTLQLEIETWWLWRGYLQDGYSCYRGGATRSRQDPSDKEDYDVVSAFPTQKPSFDVFGVPRRTRSQRGWYHIQRHPKAKPKQHTGVLSASQFPSDASATGADIPVELVRLVGKLISSTLTRAEDDDRRTITASALVCRYWASLFLPNMFRVVRICSRQRAFGLWGLDRDPDCWFRRFVRPKVYVDIKDLSHLSCVHLLTRHREMDLYLTGPLPPGWKTIRSVHQALPHSLPASFSCNIVNLRLTDIRFRRFADFIHLICELPDLRILHCTSVTWGPVPITLGTLPRRRCTQTPPQLFSVNIFMKNMSASWAQAQVHILAHLLRRNGYPCLSNDTMAVLLAIGPFIESMSDACNDSKSSVYFPMTVSWGRDCLSLQWRRGLSAFCVQAISRTCPRSGTSVLDVKDVIVDHSLTSDHDTKWKALDWRKLDEQVALLNPTQLIFAFKSREHLVAFGNEVVDTSMPHASACGSLRYAIKVSRGARYCKASRDSDDMSEPQASLLRLYSPWCLT